MKSRKSRCNWLVRKQTSGDGDRLYWYLSIHLKEGRYNNCDYNLEDYEEELFWYSAPDHAPRYKKSVAEALAQKVNGEVVGDRWHRNLK